MVCIVEFVVKSRDFNFIKYMDFQGNYLGIPSISHIIIKEILFSTPHSLTGSWKMDFEEPRK